MATVVAPLAPPHIDEHFMMSVHKRANCLGSRVDAVLVLRDRILSTGYNGTAEGTPNSTVVATAARTRIGTSQELLYNIHVRVRQRYQVSGVAHRPVNWNP